MTVNILPASNVINVSVTETPLGLTVKNVNSLLLLTQDAPGNGETFGIYVAPSQAGGNYDTGSVTMQMVNNVFAQTPNILSGGGRLIIAPMQGAVSATPGNFATPNISANLAGIIAVTNGSLNVSVNEVEQSLTGLNFTSCTTFANIAAVFNNVLVDCICSAVANGLVFTSNKVGTDSQVAITAGSGGTDLNGTAFLHGATGTPTDGSASSGETVAQAVTRLKGIVGFVGVMSSVDLEDTVASATAAFIQAQDMFFFSHFGSTQDITGISATIQQASQTKTRCLVYTQGMAAANLYKAAYAGRACSVDFTGSLTSQTMNLKTLANVLPDPGITQTLFDEAGASEATGTGCDLYVSFDGDPSVSSNGANDYFDNVYSDLAAKFALQVAGYNFLKQTNTKIPQTEPGMDGLKDAYRKVCNQFVTNGCWAPGSWLSSETFGDPTIFNNNITAKGFYIFSQPVATQSSSDRDNRIAPLVQIAAKRAGAIHSGSVLVNVNA